MMELALFTGQMGTLLIKLFFLEGGCSGEIFFYYPDGQIQAVEQFKNNVRHGVCKQFSEDGTIVFYLGTKMVKRYIMRVIPI